MLSIDIRSFRTAICTGAQEAIYSALCAAIAVRASAAVIGHGLERSTQIGPIQNAAQFAKAKHYISVGEKDGQVIAGAR
ncbi:aldehyde dehydrogenase family protein [Paraburkholderia hospita]|uniref:aldehyde dehydrogenase family protein n=1 Tax=Paraburkholderia hospita TaxID=169430 RepID=UPI000DEF45F0